MATGCLPALLGLVHGPSPRRTKTERSNDRPAERAGDRKSQSRGAVWSHVRIDVRGPILSAAESRFFSVLRQAVRSDEVVFAKVRLGDILVVRTKESTATIARNRINQKHVDFLICCSSTFALLMGVELDDATYSRKSAQIADADKDAAFAAARLTLLRVRAARSYDVESLRRRINAGRQSR